MTLGLFDWVDAFGSLSYAGSRSSLARFAAEVAPALRELTPA